MATKDISFLFYIILVTVLVFMGENRVAQLLKGNGFDSGLAESCAIIFALLSWSIFGYGGSILFYGVDENGNPNVPR